MSLCMSLVDTAAVNNLLMASELQQQEPTMQHKSGKESKACLKWVDFKRTNGRHYKDKDYALAGL